LAKLHKPYVPYRFVSIYHIKFNKLLRNELKLQTSYLLSSTQLILILYRYAATCFNQLHSHPQTLYITKMFLVRSRNSVGFTMILVWTGRTGHFLSVPCTDRRVSSPKRPDWLWGALSLLFSGYRSYFPRRRALGFEADLSPPCSNENNNEQNCIFKASYAVMAYTRITLSYVHSCGCLYIDSDYVVWVT
jgi:hypothetical protein